MIAKVSFRCILQILTNASTYKVLRIVKLPAHRPELPGNVVSFHIVPLYPAYKAGLAGHVPVNAKVRRFSIEEEHEQFRRLHRSA